LSAPLWLVFLDALSKAWTPYDKPQIYQMQPGLAIGLFDDIFHNGVCAVAGTSGPPLLSAEPWPRKGSSDVGRAQRICGRRR